LGWSSQSVCPFMQLSLYAVYSARFFAVFC
jgi:hypothetical protein